MLKRRMSVLTPSSDEEGVSTLTDRGREFVIQAEAKGASGLIYEISEYIAQTKNKLYIYEFYC